MDAKDLNLNNSITPDDELEKPEGPPIQSQINARAKIIEILNRVEMRQAFTDKLLEKELNEFEEADRSLITEVVYGVLRWRYRLDWFLRQLYVGEFEDLIPDVKNNLRSSLYQLMFLEKIPPYAVLNEAVEIAKQKFNQKTANLVNAILRNYLRQQKKLEYMEMQLDVLERMAVQYSHPKWLLQRWIEYWGVDEVTHLIEKNNERPKLFIRVNHLKTDREQVKQVLEQAGLEYEEHPDFPNFLWIKDFSAFRKLDLLRQGWVSVQDVSTGLPVMILDPQPGETVLDACAAPGGKAGFIGERMQNQGLLVAIDRHFNRVKMLRDNLLRWGITTARYIQADATQLPMTLLFDKILLDVPCTGFGVLNKRVDLKWKRSAEDIENMQRLQLQMLDAAARVCKPGGAIVYSTCTIEPEENEVVVEKFLETHPEFQLENLMGELPVDYLWNQHYVRTFPHKHDMDGSFAARLRKRPV
ncbi:MAG: 16S rRNA (cytosine(967)-C(5))-methyltransferase RsmB [Calditrichaeota bacterium]|nr:16S rRNA (cytosine(967)-C(5))-methyltransferase RsmB [Calditrichota bacterium]